MTWLVGTRSLRWRAGLTWLIPLVCALMLAAGCSGGKDGAAREFVEEYQKLLKRYKYDEAYALLSPSYAFSEFGSPQQFRIWLVSAGQSGNLTTFTNGKFFGVHRPDTRITDVYMRQPGSKRYLKFSLIKEDGSFRVDNIVTDIEHPMND